MQNFSFWKTHPPKMIELLRFILRYGSPLLEKHRFEITDSKNSPEESNIHLRNLHTSILLSQKRGELPIIEFQSLYQKNKEKWHQLHHISTILKRPTQERRLNDANTAFFLTHIDAIIKLFSPENKDKTLQKLAELQNTNNKKS